MSEKYIIPTPGDVIAGKYHIEEELGRGAYGVVFRARQEGIDRHVALKTLLPKAFLETDIVERFEREANFVGRLNHPNIVGVHDYGRHENLLYMSVEYVEGETLDEIIANGPLAPERVRGLVYQMVDALEHAHDTGIVHRDLKPANIVILKKPVDESGEEKEVVKVLDFGIAKLIQSETEEETPETLTQAGTVLGTPHYMSPESIIGDEVDHRTDIYALGVMIYEMLTGERPFGAKNSPSVMVKHLRDEPPELPAHLAGSCWGDAVRGCMEKRAEKRLQSATEIREILERRDEGKYRASVPDGSTAKAQALTPPRTARRTLVPAIAIGILTAVGIAIGFQWIPLGDDGGERAHNTAAQIPAGIDDTPGDPESVAENPVAEKPVDEEPRAPKDPETMNAGDGARGDGDDAPAIADRSNTLGAARQLPQDQPTQDQATDEPATDDPTTDDPTANKQRVGAKSTRDARARRDKERREPKRRVKKRPAKKQVSVHIETVPTNARVTVAGTPVGASPVDHTLAAGDDPVTIELHLIGYRTKFRTIVPNKDQTLRVELEKGRLKLIP